MHTVFWVENLKGRDHLEDLGVDGRIILEWLLGREDVDWIRLALHRSQWRAIVTTVLKLQFP